MVDWPLSGSRCHLKGLLVSVDRSMYGKQVSDVRNICFRHKFVDGTEIVVIRIVADVPPPESLIRSGAVERLDGVGYGYLVVALDLSSRFSDGATGLAMILCCSVQVLSGFVASLGSTGYGRIDTSKLLSSLLVAPGPKNMDVKRLNIRILGDGDSGVSSVALFGNDVLNRNILIDLCGLNRVSADQHELAAFDPFGLKLNSIPTRRQLRPNSARIIWTANADDLSPSVCAVNFDIYGNYSMTLSSFSEVVGLSLCLDFLQKQGFLVTQNSFDPTKRSKRALEIINNGCDTECWTPNIQ